MVFEEIYKMYWQKIFRLCMGYCNDLELAKDLTQDTFVIVFQKIDSFRNESLISTWIYRIATNLCLQQIEKDKRIIKTDFSQHLIAETTNEITQQLGYLYAFIAELGEMDRIIISLELEEVKQEEIAKIVGLSEGNIRVKIHRIKEKLATKFKNHYHE